MTIVLHGTKYAISWCPTLGSVVAAMILGAFSVAQAKGEVTRLNRSLCAKLWNENPITDPDIDPQGKALFLAALAARDAWQTCEFEAKIESRSLVAEEPFHYRSTELSVMDRPNRRYFFQQEKQFLLSPIGPATESARILIRDGKSFQKLSRDRQEFSLRTIKGELALHGVTNETHLFNVFDFGWTLHPSNDFGPGDLYMRNGLHSVKSLLFKELVDDNGTQVRVLYFLTETTGAPDTEWFLWIDPVTFRLHRNELVGRHVAHASYDPNNVSAIPNSLEVAFFDSEQKVSELTIHVTRLEIDKSMTEDDFRLERLNPVLNDLVVDYDQKRIIGRWNGHSYLGEEPINSPTVEAAITEQRLAGQTSTPWLTYVIWAAIAIVAVYLLVRLTRPRSKTV
jgi:hypothetical protein